MSQEPRRNERRFYRYPRERVTAIINDDQSLDKALHDLAEAGVKLGAVNVLQKVVDILRRAGAHYLLYFHRWTVEELRF